MGLLQLVGGRQERVRQQPPKSKRASNALIDNFPSLTHRDRSQSQPSGEAIGPSRCVRAHGLMRQRIDSPGQRRSRSSVLQMDLILEPVQKLSDEPRKEYAAGIWLFSFEACIRVI